MSSFLNVQIEAAVVEQARRGDGAAQEAIYRRFADPVYTLIRRLVVRPAVAEELLQDVFVEVLLKLSAFNGSGSFAGWVRSIAVSKALMHVRSPWHRRLLSLTVASEPPPELPRTDGGSFEDRSADLEQALNRLPATTRSVVWLHDVEGLTHAEIGRLFGRTPSFSKSQLMRAHAQLRQWLETPAGEMTCVRLSRI
jgi:RNA polymerase sigma factor (sigma-70 family)